ncbi:MAG: NUDIX domain-containing protein [Myxococcota bacterium]|nr:NUDIX domain-containing protein [Myxococcota bacterium]
MNRIARLARIPRTYLKIAWWGLVAPIISECEPLVVVQAVILGDGEQEGAILLSVRADVRGWELPGGNFNPGEGPEQALVREIEEETGLQAEIVRRVGDYVRTGFRPHVARVFLCRVQGGEPRPSRETPRVAWWPLERLPSTLFPWYQQPIRDALSDGTSPLTRTERQGVAAIVDAIRIDLRMRWLDDRAE